MAVLNLGRARFAATGPMSYTFDSAAAVKAAKVLKARIIIPNHFEGFTLFRQRQEEARKSLLNPASMCDGCPRARRLR